MRVRVLPVLEGPCDSEEPARRIVVDRCLLARSHGGARRAIGRQRRPGLLNVVTPSDPVAVSRFGQQLAVSGETMIVSPRQWFIRRPRRDFDNVQAVYVFVRSADGWTQQQRIVLPDENGVTFDLAIDRDTLAISIEHEVQVWVRESGAWYKQASLHEMGRYAGALAIDGDTLLAGDYVFTRSGSAVVAAAETCLTHDCRRRARTASAASVALKGDTASRRRPVRVHTGLGTPASYTCFEAIGWHLEAECPSRPKRCGCDGHVRRSVAFDGTQIAAASPDGNPKRAQSACGQRSGSGWAFMQQITSPDGRPGYLVEYGGDWFGSHHRSRG